MRERLVLAAILAVAVLWALQDLLEALGLPALVVPSVQLVLLALAVVLVRKVRLDLKDLRGE